MVTILSHDRLGLVYGLELDGKLVRGPELDGTLVQVYGLGQGGRLVQVCGLEQHDNHSLLEQVGMEQHNLRRIHQQHIQCNDPRCILRFGAFHQGEKRYNDHKQHFHLSFLLLQSWYLCIHL